MSSLSEYLTLANQRLPGASPGAKTRRLLANDVFDDGAGVSPRQLGDKVPGALCTVTQTVKHCREQKSCNEHRDIERAGRCVLERQRPATDSCAYWGEVYAHAAKRTQGRAREEVRWVMDAQVETRK